MNLNHRNDQVGQTTDRLLEAEADVLIFLEWTGKNADTALLMKGGYRPILDRPRTGTHGIAIYARSGIQGLAELVEAPVSSPCMLPVGVARLDLDGITFCLIGVHAPPPVPSCKGANLPTLEAMADWFAKGRLVADLGPARKGDKVILAGDFNAMPSGRGISRLSESGLADVLGRGWFLKPTWSPSSWIPSLIRIDYLLVGRAFGASESYTLNIKGSDHRAVVGDVLIR